MPHRNLTARFKGASRHLTPRQSRAGTWLSHRMFKFTHQDLALSESLTKLWGRTCACSRTRSLRRRICKKPTDSGQPITGLSHLQVARLSTEKDKRKQIKTTRLTILGLGTILLMLSSLSIFLNQTLSKDIDQARVGEVNATSPKTAICPNFSKPTQKSNSAWLINSNFHGRKAHKRVPAYLGATWNISPTSRCACR